MKTRDKLILGIAALLLLSAIAWWLIDPALTLPAPEESNRSKVPPPRENSSTQTPPLPQPTSTRAPTLAKLSPPNSVDDTNRKSQRKFAEMDVLDRGKIMKEIRAKDLAAIFQHLLDAGRVENDSQKQMGLYTMLFLELANRPPNQEFLKMLQGFIESDEPSKFERKMALILIRFQDETR